MNKNDFLNELNLKSGLSKKDCKLCLNVMIDVIKSVLKNGENVELSNFGKFKINTIGPKTIYNFKTKNTELVDERKTLTFKASDNLKKCIKQN